jgi:predicted DNA-binding transcriptional regulator YafY
MEITNETVNIVYTNYRNETAVRKVVPKKIWFGGTDWHPEEQWLLDAYDIEKQADRSFAMKDIRSWFPEK